jgi:hypothetical protein
MLSAPVAAVVGDPDRESRQLRAIEAVNLAFDEAFSVPAFSALSSRG